MTTKSVKQHTNNQPLKQAPLSLNTQKVLAKLLKTIAKNEIKIETQRQYLANNKQMEPYSIFQRIDRDEDGFISSMELLYFLRDNQLNLHTEAECYYIVKFFDSDEDGKLNYPDFMQMILPCDNTYLRAEATQRPNVYISKFDYLTLDLERDVSKLIQLEIKLHQKSEILRQRLESMQDFTWDRLYSIIDDWGYGYVDTRNLYRFFNNNKLKISEDQIIAIIRRLDTDCDSKLKKEEVIQGLCAQEPFSKMLIREEIKKEVMKQQAKLQNQMNIKKGHQRINKKPEFGEQEEEVTRQGLDRSYNNVLSSSPLKY